MIKVRSFENKQSSIYIETYTKSFFREHKWFCDDTAIPDENAVCFFNCLW